MSVNDEILESVSNMCCTEIMEVSEVKGNNDHTLLVLELSVIQDIIK